MSFPGILDSLSDDQREQLLTWLELLPRAEVLARVAVPPPEGFGLKTHLTSLARFHERAQRAERERLLQTAAPLSDEQRDLLRRSAEDAFLQHVLHLAAASGSHPHSLSALGKILDHQQRNEIRLRELEIREREVDLTAQRLRLEQQRVAGALAIREASLENDLAASPVKEILRQITPA